MPSAAGISHTPRWAACESVTVNSVNSNSDT